MSFYFARDVLNTIIQKQIASLVPESAHLKTAFAASAKSTDSWQKSRNQILLSNTEDDLLTALAAMQPTLRDELLKHKHHDLHKNRAIRFFPMDYLLDRAIRLLFSERGKHTQEFKHILDALNPAYTDSAVAYCSGQTYATQHLPNTGTTERRPEELLADAENALGDQYPTAFCMLNKAFRQNASLPTPLAKGGVKRALAPSSQGPAPAGM